MTLPESIGSMDFLSKCRYPNKTHKHTSLTHEYNKLWLESTQLYYSHNPIIIIYILFTINTSFF